MLTISNHQASNIFLHVFKSSFPEQEYPKVAAKKSAVLVDRPFKPHQCLSRRCPKTPSPTPPPFFFRRRICSLDEPRVLEQFARLEPLLGLLLHQGLDQLLGILAGWGWAGCTSPEEQKHVYQRPINKFRTHV